MLVGCSSSTAGHSGQSAGATVPVGTAPVVRTTVAERQEVTGALGYSGNYNLFATVPGTLTWLPAAGHVVRRGQPAYEMNGVKVPLMYGPRPAWRSFELGMTDGSDVLELNKNLVALGYANGIDLVVDDHFSFETYLAVLRWQMVKHLPVTGTVSLGQVAFLPGPLRVGGSSLATGAQVQQGQIVIYGTGTARAVLVQLTPSALPSVHVGDPVTVTLPNGSSRTGTIRKIGAVAVPQNSNSGDNSQSSGSSGESGPTALLTISVHGKVKGWLDQAQVQVGIVSQQDKNVLAVPTVALLAAPGGKYQVIVVNGSHKQYVTVQPSLFDENTGLTEVTGNLSVGQRVEVPHGSS